MSYLYIALYQHTIPKNCNKKILTTTILQAAPEPVEPVRMTPAQERALRYMQRADRFLELLTRNTHEV